MVFVTEQLSGYDESDEEIQYHLRRVNNLYKFKRVTYPEGVTNEWNKLSTGRFSKVYENLDDGMIYIRTTDPLKEVYSMYLTEMPYVPKIERLYFEDNYYQKWYRMEKLYPVTGTNLGIVRGLKRIYNKMIVSQSISNYGSLILQSYVDEVEVSQYNEYTDALYEMLMCAMNQSNNLGFDLSQRNTMQNHIGELVFIDPYFIRSRL